MSWERRPDLSPRFAGDFGWHSLSETARSVMDFEEAYERMTPEGKARAREELRRAREVVREMAIRGEYV